MEQQALTTAPADGDGDIMERVIVAGDLKNLSPADRVNYYKATCESLGLNPLTRPFEYITLNSKLTLYAGRNCADQLRRLHHIDIRIVGRERIDDLYVVTAHATAPDGRGDEEIGAVNVGGLRGEALANAMMKATTKAKRRVTLSIVGLGWLDESETDSIPDARPAHVNPETGEIVSATQTPSPTPPQAEAQPKPTNGHRPLSADKLIAALNRKAGDYAREDGGDEKVADDMKRWLGSALDKLFDGATTARYAFTKAVFGIEHTGDLTRAQGRALLDWLGIPGGGFVADSRVADYCRTEAGRVLDAQAQEVAK